MANELTVHLRQASHSLAEATIRNHRVLVDRPVAKGGSDLGPMGGELFLAAIGGCFMSNLLGAILAREANISEVKVEVTGTLADGPARFVGVELLVTAGNADQELLDKFVKIADRGCIMMNTLRGILHTEVRTEAAV
jgi:putative redox protein